MCPQICTRFVFTTCVRYQLRYKFADLVAQLFSSLYCLFRLIPDVWHFCCRSGGCLFWTELASRKKTGSGLPNGNRSQQIKQTTAKKCSSYCLAVSMNFNGRALLACSFAVKETRTITRFNFRNDFWPTFDF